MIDHNKQKQAQTEVTYQTLFEFLQSTPPNQGRYISNLFMQHTAPYGNVIKEINKPELELCTATGNSGHSLRQDCATITIYLKGVSDGENENEETSLPSLKPKLFLRLSAVKVPKQKCVGGPHNLSDEQLSKWKRQLLENAATLFEPAVTNSLMPLRSGLPNLSNSLGG